MKSIPPVQTLCVFNISFRINRVSRLEYLGRHVKATVSILRNNKFSSILQVNALFRVDSAVSTPNFDQMINAHKGHQYYSHTSHCSEKSILQPYDIISVLLITSEPVGNCQNWNSFVVILDSVSLRILSFLWNTSLYCHHDVHYIFVKVHRTQLLPSMHHVHPLLRTCKPWNGLPKRCSICAIPWGSSKAYKQSLKNSATHRQPLWSFRCKYIGHDGHPLIKCLAKSLDSNQRLH